jgi:ABC-type Fe3+/spermidine/putrescine transport system ATPase subunit
MARPETLRIAHVPTSVAGTVLQGRIERRAFLGSVARYWVRTSEGEWIVDEPASDSAPRQQNVQIVLNAERLHLLPRE